MLLPVLVSSLMIIMAIMFLTLACLLQDIRTLGAPTNQILAILSKPASKEYSLYSTIEYQAKGISVDSIRSLKAFRSLISL